MKKIINFILVLGILFLVFQLGVTFFKNKHSVDYSLKVADKKISIHEEYYKDKQVDYYYLELTVDKTKFVFDTDNSFNKQKKIINDIKVFEDDELICISPVYIKNNNDPEIVCNIGNDQYSYASIKDDYDLEEFIDGIDNFNKGKYETSALSTTINRNTVYKENIYENENILVYEYSNLLKITNNDHFGIHFADYDVYDNELGILIDKYYVLPKYENKPEYSKLLVIDIEKEIVNEIKIEEKLSTNIYINGVVNDKLYIFDRSNLVQYEIDPKKNNYRITGNKNVNAQYFDGKWSTKNIYDFSKQELKFEYDYPVKENYTEAFETEKSYYYYNTDNEFYKVYKKNLNKPIFLFSFDDIDEVNVINDSVYFINDNTLYRYDDTGLKKILVNKEFRYNYDNIYSVYVK